MAKQTTHGGKRKNAGRKPPETPIKLRAFRLTDDEMSLLRAWGNGDATAGLRGLIEKCLATWPKR